MFIFHSNLRGFQGCQQNYIHLTGGPISFLRVLSNFEQVAKQHCSWKKNTEIFLKKIWYLASAMQKVLFTDVQFNQCLLCNIDISCLFCKISLQENHWHQDTMSNIVSFLYSLHPCYWSAWQHTFDIGWMNYILIIPKNQSQTFIYPKHWFFLINFMIIQTEFFVVLNKVPISGDINVYISNNYNAEMCAVVFQFLKS